MLLALILLAFFGVSSARTFNPQKFLYPSKQEGGETVRDKIIETILNQHEPIRNIFERHKSTQFDFVKAHLSTALNFSISPKERENEIFKSIVLKNKMELPFKHLIDASIPTETSLTHIQLHREQAKLAELLQYIANFVRSYDRLRTDFVGEFFPNNAKLGEKIFSQLHDLTTEEKYLSASPTKQRLIVHFTLPPLV